ncbi:hypothetical protein QTP88_024992 [Uroleucon formosanum]
MVVFTCNNCGDSVNKPKVEKHIQYECKRKNFAVSFCCVDCLKDFNYETVRDHCQCVTEDQRYSAKGYVPKPSAEKGKRKQAAWVDIVQSVMNNKDLPNEQRQFLNIIAKFDNVPRKKNKFQNFCFSTAPAYRRKEYIIDQVFDMIEAEYKAQQPQNSNEKPVDNESENLVKNVSIQEESQEIKNKISFGNEEIINNSNGNNETEETPKKKKKKSKKSFDAANNETKLKSTKKRNITEEAQPNSAKKYKKNKINTENIKNGEFIQEPQEIKKKNIIESETIVTLNNCSSEETLKKKKKSKKSFDAANNETELQSTKKRNITEEVQPNSAKKYKKNKINTENIKNGESIQEPQEIKKKNIIDSETIVTLNNCSSEETLKKKKKSKKSFDAANNEPELQSTKKGNITEEAQPNSAKKYKKNKINTENIKNGESIQEPQEIKKKNIIDSETIVTLNNCSSEETPKKKKKSKKSLDAVICKTETKSVVEQQSTKKKNILKINSGTEDNLKVKEGTADAVFY